MSIPNQIEVTLALTNSDDEKIEPKEYEMPEIQHVRSTPAPEGWGRLALTRRNGEGIELVLNGELIAYVILRKRPQNSNRQLVVIAPQSLRVHRSKYVEEPNQPDDEQAEIDDV